jgi:hypothetical protein
MDGEQCAYGCRRSLELVKQSCRLQGDVNLSGGGTKGAFDIGGSGRQGDQSEGGGR